MTKLWMLSLLPERKRGCCCMWLSIVCVVVVRSRWDRLGIRAPWQPYSHLYSKQPGNVGALIIRIGLGGIFYYNYNKESPQNPILIIKAPAVPSKSEPDAKTSPYPPRSGWSVAGMQAAEETKMPLSYPMAASTDYLYATENPINSGCSVARCPHKV